MKKKFLKSDPTEESLKLIKESSEQIFPDQNRLSDWSANYIRNHRKRISIDLDLVKERGVKGRILEFGSVPLLLTLALKKSGFNVTGVDISPERYSKLIAELNMDIIKCDIEHEKLPIEDNSFDFILFNELFEHLRINPIFTLSEAFRVLKPSGVMLLSTPNLRSIKGLYNFVLRNRSHSLSGDIYNEYSKLDTIGHMGHVREYTTKEVVDFMQKIGFSAVEVCYRGTYSKKLELFRKLFPTLSPFVTYVFKK